MRQLLTFLCAWLLLASSAFAAGVEADEALPDAAQEERARALSREIRCPVCSGESIAESNASISRELRLVVREEISRGASDQEIKDYLVIRYGEAVLMQPPLNQRTWLLYASPLMFLLIGGGAIALWWRGRERVSDG